MTKKQEAGSRKQFFVAMLAVAATMASCSDRAPNTVENPAGSTQKKPLIPGLSLGEGVSKDVASNTGTGNQCISHVDTLTDPEIRPELLAHQQLEEAKYNTPFHRAFWVNSFEDFPDVLANVSEAENGQGMLDFYGLSTIAYGHYYDNFQSVDAPLLSLLVVVPTADRNATAVGGATTQSGCASHNGSPINPQPSTLAEWVNTCGVRYLEEEKLGQVFLMSARLPDMKYSFGVEEDQGWMDTLRIFQVESYTNQTDSLARFEDFATRYPDAIFHVSAVHELQGGAYPPFVDPGDPVIRADEFGDFVRFYQDQAHVAVVNEDYTRLGYPIWQLATAYSATAHLEEVCGISQNEIAQAFGCYSYFEDRVRTIERRITPQVGKYVDAIQNPQRYIQPNDARDWERFLYESWDPLISDLPSLLSDCDDALDSGDETNICTYCDAQRIDDVIEEFNSLTEPRLLEHPDHPTARDASLFVYTLTNNDAMSPGSIDDLFCGFHRMSGKLEGGGEGATLSRVNSDWYFETWSHQTANATRLRAGIICTDGITRGPSCGGTFCAWNQTCSAGNCVSSQTYHDATATGSLAVNNASNSTTITPPAWTGLPDKPYLAMFAGISGKTRGLGEEVIVLQGDSATPAQIAAGSQQGYLEGWYTGTYITDAASHAFEVISDDAQNPYEVTNSNASAVADESKEVTLAPANQSFCYLTSVGGKFDGAGETADLAVRSGSWVLRTRSTGTDDCAGDCGPFLACGCTYAKPLRATARCIDLHQ